jgi:hypothetical protein
MTEGAQHEGELYAHDDRSLAIAVNKKVDVDDIVANPMVEEDPDALRTLHGGDFAIKNNGGSAVPPDRNGRSSKAGAVEDSLQTLCSTLCKI